MDAHDNAALPTPTEDLQAIEPEVLEPVPAQPPALPRPAPVPTPTLPPADHPEAIGFLLHPLSGLLILFLDYAFFAKELFTGGLGMPTAAVLAFILSGTGVFLVQRFLGEDTSGRATAKAFIGGVVTGIPTPITGTVFATIILGVSGLNLLSRLFQRRR